MGGWIDRATSAAIFSGGKLHRDLFWLLFETLTILIIGHHEMIRRSNYRVGKK
jgi:hypothetical protein